MAAWVSCNQANMQMKIFVVICHLGNTAWLLTLCAADRAWLELSSACVLLLSDRVLLQGSGSRHANETASRNDCSGGNYMWDVLK